MAEHLYNIEGMVFRVDPDAGLAYSPRGMVCKPFPSEPDGYVKVIRFVGEAPNRRKAYRSVHRMVWEVVHGPIPKGMQINHINGIKHDNRIANLELVTHRENAMHAIRLGLTRAARGEQSGSAKLTEEIVREIRASPDTCKAIARRLGVSGNCIEKVRNGLTWRHVK